MKVVGTEPRLPRPLARSKWWTLPVRAERLAALRIGVGLILLMDILTTYWSISDLLFGEGSLGPPEVMADRPVLPLWILSPLGQVSSAGIWWAVLLAWAVCAVLLTLGITPRLAAAGALLIAMSISNANPYLFNGGDSVRHILLFYLVLTPTAAAWAFGKKPEPGETYVWPWALRLLFVQMCVIYFANGFFKLESLVWQDGTAMHYVLQGPYWTMGAIPMSLGLIRLMSWITLVWELGFVLLVANPRTRQATLLLGIVFHLTTTATLRIGFFGLYMLCLYLPLAPWERLGRPPVGAVDVAATAG